MLVRQLLVVAAILVCEAGGAKILALFPFLGESHHNMFTPLLEELNKRGHHLVVVTPFPRDRPLDNYREISLKDVASEGPYVKTKLQLEFFSGSFTRNSVVDMLQLYWLLHNYEGVFRLEEFRKAIALEEGYDLVLTEQFNTDMFLGVPYKLGVPFVALSSSVAMPWSFDRLANPDAPVIFDATFSEGQETFIQRLFNALDVWFCKAIYVLIFEPYSQRVAERYLGPLPPLSEIAKNTSLLLLNTHNSFHRARPDVPAVVEVGGLHIPPRKPLPQDLENFLNRSKDGVIYFSMGTVLRGETWPNETREIFFNVFSKLKQNILWKWEGEELPFKSKNILHRKWFPQTDILGHPNVVLFITHGGMFSVTEAVECGVPLLGFPVFGDQGLNLGAVSRAGAALSLDLGSITEQGLATAVHALITQPKYRENARLLSAKFKDRPEPPMEAAVYWIEYVIRHGGAPHLKSPAVHLPFHKYLLLDVIAFIIAAIFALIFSIYTITKLIIRKLFVREKKHKTK